MMTSSLCSFEHGPRTHRTWLSCATCIVSLIASPDNVGASDAVARRWTPPSIASDQYESSASFTPDGRELFFVRSDISFGNWRILHSRCERGTWSRPQAAPFAAAPPAVEADPFVTQDGRRVYFVSSRQAPKNPDDLDIWSVDRRPDGTWAAPQRLPEPVNTPYSELLPRLAADGRLYFGSNRPGGFGQSDVYVATPGEGGRWRVDNLGSPVNSAANEYEADISRDGRTLIVVADRGDRSHLYRYALDNGHWLEQGRIPAATDVFQVGPLLSPHGERLMFAQKDGSRSGEMFVIDLVADPSEDWPPRCEAERRAH